MKTSIISIAMVAIIVFLLPLLIWLFQGAFFTLVALIVWLRKTLIKEQKK